VQVLQWRENQDFAPQIDVKENQYALKKISKSGT